MSGLPIGFMLGNVGRDDSDVEADYLDEETRSALLKTNTDFLFTLPKDLREEVTVPCKEEQSGAPASVDDDLMVSEGDISDGTLPEEATNVAPSVKRDDSDGESDVEMEEDEALPVSPEENEDLELPILGYGENNERIFCFSKIFTNGGLKYFFDEQRREAEQNDRKAKQMAERIKRNLERQPPPLPPVNALKAWLADPATSSESESERSEGSERMGDEPMEDVVTMSVAEEAPPKKPHLLDQKHLYKGNRVRWEDRIASNQEEGKRIWEALQSEWRVLGNGMGGNLNPHILKDDWLDNIVTSASQERPPSPKLIWDLNDPHMRFRMQDTTPDVNFSNAAATILPPKEKRRMVRGPSAWPGDVFEELAFYNVSKDELYSKDTRNVVTSKNRVSDGSVSLNAVSALSLSTIPIHTADEEALDYHTRGNTFYPTANTSHAQLNKNLPDNNVEIILRSVTGRVATLVRTIDGTSTVTIGEVYKSVQSKAFPDAKNEQPLLFLESPFRKVDASETVLSIMQSSGLTRNLVIWVQFETVNLIPDAATDLPSSNSKLPVRPPGAFGKKKELTATDGHVLLFEYLEENPLLRFYPGMGAVLQTCIQSRENKDQQTHTEELEQKHQSIKWKYGQVKIIPNDKPSPFIASFQSSPTVFSVESHLIRAAACAYDVHPTDFLLVWSPSGNWSIRKITGALAVGQQQPLVKIHPPLASNIKDFEERRLVSYACRKLSHQVRKTGQDTKKNDTIISVEELTNMFPVLSESVIKSRLKDRCQCIPIRGAEGSFTLKPSATHQSESELRQILSPEEVSAYDSCRMFKARMARLGLKHVDRLTQIPSDKWKLALSLLPEDMKQIALYIQRTIQGAPWNQSEGYHAWKGGKGQVSVLGPGEPSGRGICCSYTKEHLRKTEDSILPVKPQPVITGTKADLRRLGAEDAITALQSLPDNMHSTIEFEDLRKMDRWEIIRHIRAIATAAVQDGIELSPELAKFARNPRSTMQIAVGLKRKVEQVFAKQLRLLRNEEADTKPLPVKAKPQGRREETQAKPGKRRIRRTVITEDGSEREVVLSMETYDHIPWGGPEGMRQMDGKKRIIEGRHPSAVVMEEQIVERTLMTKRPAIGSRSKTIAQVGQSRIVFNNLPTKPKKPKRPRTKLTKEEIWGNRYHYFERKPRLNNRKKRRVINFPHTIQSLEEEELLKALAKPKSKRALQQALIQQQQMKAAGEPVDQETDSFLMRQVSLLSELGMSGSLDLGSFSADGKQKLPYKTKDGRRMTGRKVLNTKILNKIHTLVTKQRNAKPFKVPVNKMFAPDYNDFVPPAEEIWLDKIGSKIRGLKYSTGQMYLDDLRKLLNNAIAYNSPGHGRFGGPQLIDIARGLVQFAEEEVEKVKDDIVSEESRIRSEDTEKELKRSGSLSLAVAPSPRPSTAL